MRADERIVAVIQACARTRRENGLSQDVVARRMGTKQGAVNGIETLRLNPKLETLDRYARACGAGGVVVVLDVGSLEGSS